jgi:hypothetical protein
MEHKHTAYVSAGGEEEEKGDGKFSNVNSSGIFGYQSTVPLEGITGYENTLYKTNFLYYK